jgi:RNA-binding protein Musashi
VWVDFAPLCLQRGLTLLLYACSEDTLRLHFSQYGVVEAAEVMKDRFSGKSRGFGFVTFVDPAAAQRALAMEHTVDGRRCEAKIALPKV